MVMLMNAFLTALVLEREPVRLRSKNLLTTGILVAQFA